MANQDSAALTTYVTPLRNEDLEKSRPNPQKRNLLVKRLALAPWWVLVLLGMVLAFAIVVSDRLLYQRAWEEIRQGISMTLRVTVTGYALALLMGLILALLRRPSKSTWYNLLVYQPVTTYVELIRGIPTLVILLYIVVALTPFLVNNGADIGQKLLDEDINFLGIPEYMSTLRPRDIDFVYRAVIALAISYSAFLSEIFRAGLESIPEGQREAARSLGMKEWQVNRLIILPQAIRNVLPPLGNDFIAMLKESSLVAFVGVKDITRLAYDFRSATLNLFPAYNILALTYLTLTLALSLLVKLLEMYLNRSRHARE
ncbi:MAG: amino acid ABC transporter permease [Anaerolineae bacterium]|nr:amino acid ABC transporter permease [Anaerolineae bacterium]